MQAPTPSNVPRALALALACPLAFPSLCEAAQRPEPGAGAPQAEGAAPPQELTPMPRVPIEHVLVTATSFLPRPRSRFGAAVQTLDFDGDGHDDIAVGAPGESAVYVFLGPEFDQAQRFRPHRLERGDGFGTSLAAGTLDGRPGDELVIGAPDRTVDGVAQHGAVFLLSVHATRPTELRFEGLPAGALGHAVAVGDFDGDGELDVAAGAPKTLIGGQQSGAVALLSLRPRSVRTLSNPRGSWLHGNYGHDLAVGDADGDGVDDLFVSGIGNRSSDGVRGAGQVFVHLRPLAADGATLIAEDPSPTLGDPARFGMSISAGDVDGDGLADLLVGAPRKDGGGIRDAGSGFLFFAPDFGPDRAQVLLRPAGEPHDILGFRALIADVSGAGRSAVLLASLARKQDMGILAWNPRELGAGPTIHLPPQGASHHFVQGMRPGPRIPGQGRTLLLGDPNFDPGSLPDSGRMLVITLEAPTSAPVPVADEPPPASR